MGNSSSQPSEQEQASVFTLSDDLQEQMAEEYNNEQVVKLFGKQMEQLGERKAEMIKDKVEHKTLLEQRMEQFRKQNGQLQNELDRAIEASEDRFTDTVNVLEYDATRLEKKYLEGRFLQTSEIPCLAERSNMASCYTKNKEEPSVCDSFIESLTECSSKTIVAK